MICDDDDDDVIVNTDDCVTATCANGASCVDDVNDYRCECLPGYMGTYCDGMTHRYLVP